MRSITVDFPGAGTLPEELREDPELARYLIVGALFSRGRLSLANAAQLTGDSVEELEAKLEGYGFSTYGSAVAESEPPGPGKTRWQALAERLDDEGFLDGRSAEARELLAASRVTL